jgi:hypothetical protein
MDLCRYEKNVYSLHLPLVEQGNDLTAELTHSSTASLILRDCTCRSLPFSTLHFLVCLPQLSAARPVVSPSLCASFLFSLSAATTVPVRLAAVSLRTVALVPSAVPPSSPLVHSSFPRFPFLLPFSSSSLLFSNIGTPSAREKVLNFIRDPIRLNHPNPFVCITSRLENDINNAATIAP